MYGNTFNIIEAFLSQFEGLKILDSLPADTENEVIEVLYLLDKSLITSLDKHHQIQGTLEKKSSWIWDRAVREAFGASLDENTKAIANLFKYEALFKIEAILSLNKDN